MDAHGDYRNYLLRRGLSPQSIRAYLEAVDRLERWCGKPVDQVTPDEAAAYLNQPRHSRATRNAYHRRIAAWCAWSGSVLLDDVKRTSPPGPCPRPLAVDRVDLMLTGCRSDEDSALVLLGCTVGLRRAEIAGFRGDDLDRWESTVRVRGKGDRTAWIPATPSLVRHAASMPPAGWWFPSPVRPGEPVTPWTIGARVRRIAERAGAGTVTTHRLRHTYATELVRRDVPLTTVQHLMRHAKLETTAGYVAVDGDDMQGAVRRLPWAA